MVDIAVLPFFISHKGGLKFDCMADVAETKYHIRKLNLELALVPGRE